MNKENLIPAIDFCASHNIEISFIISLHETGLIEVETIDETEYIQINQLSQLEKIVHMHFDLDINLEGIETITHLLDRIDALQHEIIVLQNRLSFYDAVE